jgi:hypothetical protein
MKLRTIALVLSVALVSAVAHAQTGVYVTADGQRFTQKGVDLPAFTNSKDVDSLWLAGTSYGIYYDFSRLPGISKLKTGRIAVGVDGRGDTFRRDVYGSQIDRQDGLFSLRIALKKAPPQKYMLKTTPYLQGGFGIGHTRNALRTYYNNDFIYQFSLGFDRPLTKKSKNLDWRMLEVSVGSLANYPTGYYSANGGYGPNQSNYMITLGSGIVFRSKR